MDADLLVVLGDPIGVCDHAAYPVVAQETELPLALTPAVRALLIGVPPAPQRPLSSLILTAIPQSIILPPLARHARFRLVKGDRRNDGPAPSAGSLG